MSDSELRNAGYAGSELVPMLHAGRVVSGTNYAPRAVGNFGMAAADGSDGEVIELSDRADTQSALDRARDNDGWPNINVGGRIAHAKRSSGYSTSQPGTE